ncbi:MAG: hypothetical protein JST65_01420 [Acidobacteria bacterium]|nr:hypothetical protein [Acidobacteriota bacterium]
MSTVQEIERAIEGLSADELKELYAWLERRHVTAQKGRSIVEQGLALFSSAEDAALLDEVVEMAYQARRGHSGS